MLQLVTDRTQQDVDRIATILKTPRALRTLQQQEELDSAASKGSYNYTDLNRVTEAMEYLVEQLNKYGYSVDYQKIKIDRSTGPLPLGYTLLESIKSSGTQYINTEVIPTGSTKIVLDVQLSSDFVTDGYPISVYGSTYRFFVKYTNNKFQAGLGTEWFKEVGTIPDAHARLVISLGENEFSVDNLSTAIAGGNFELDYPLFVCCSNNKGTPTGMVSMCIYSCSVYENSILTHSYLPCKNPSGIVGLFDTVDQVFVENSGSGEFIPGPTAVMLESDNSSLDPYSWYEDDIPTVEQMERYLLNVVNIYNVLLSNPELPATMAQLDYNGANQIEQALLIVEETIERVVRSMRRSNAFTFWSGNRPLPSADSDLGRTWEELDAMNVHWENLETADWYLLAYGNLGVTK